MKNLLLYISWGRASDLEARKCQSCEGAEGLPYLQVSQPSKICRNMGDLWRIIPPQEVPIKL